MKIKKFVFPGILLILAFAGLWWFLSPSELPGMAVPDLGREHIKESDPEPSYNSNPPTSGPHSPQWLSAGYYENEQSDRKLLHSLEHGYVVVSYNCSLRETSYKKKFSIFNFQFSIDNEVWAHGEEEATGNATPAASPSANPAATRDESCHELRDYLKELVKDLGVWKIVAAPRAKNDSRMALTAWGRIDKFNALDKGRIEKFVKAFRDKGPEATKD